MHFIRILLSWQLRDSNKGYWAGLSSNLVDKLTSVPTHFHSSYIVRLCFLRASASSNALSFVFDICEFIKKQHRCINQRWYIQVACSVDVYLYIFMYFIYIYAHIYIYTFYVHLQIYVYAYIYIYICSSLCIYLYRHIYIWVYHNLFRIYFT